MITKWETLGGHILTLGRIPRQVIDIFTGDNRPPEPPMREAETWAGPEMIPDLDAPGYQVELGLYYRNLGKLHVGLIAPAIKLPATIDLAEYRELIDADLVNDPGNDNRVGFLLYVLDGDDLEALVRIVFYNSTVTDKGINEARERFNVQWMKKPIMAWGIPGTPGGYGLEFEARRAARYSLIDWADFCALTGPEQSAFVCFYRMDARLDYFQAEWRNRKVK